MRLYSIAGNTQKLDGGAMFGNAPRALWSRWAPPDGENRIDLACRALLIEDGPRRVLCEAGIGLFFEPKLRERYGVVEPEHRLLASLAARGFSDSDVTDVVLSHLHFDHAGGLLAAWEEGAPARLLFPNARFWVGADAWDRALNPHSRDRASFIPELHALLQASGRLQVVPRGARRVDALGPDIHLHYSDGHTPGLMLLEARGAAGRLVFMGDLVPGVPWVHLPITMGYDRFPERLIDEKEALLGDLAASGVGYAFFTHDPATAMGRIGRDPKGKMIATELLAGLDGLEW